MDGEKPREEEQKAYHSWKIATEKLQTPIAKLKASPKTHLEGCFVDIVRELFGNNFVITGGFPAYVNGITDRYTDVNFLLPKSLLRDLKYDPNSVSLHRSGCQWSNTLEDRISKLVTGALERFYKKYAYCNGNGDNVSTTTSTRVLNYGLPTSVIVNSTSNDFFPHSMNAHGPMYQVMQRSVIFTRPPDYPTRYLFDECQHSSAGHKVKYTFYDSGYYTTAERHVEYDDIRQMLVHDDVHRKVKFDENGDIIEVWESMRNLPRDNPCKIKKCENMCNMVNHSDFESYWGATIISVKLSKRDYYISGEDPFRNKKDEPRLMTLVFLENISDGLKNDQPVRRTNSEEGAITCMAYGCQKEYIYGLLRSRPERLRKTFEDTHEESSNRQNVMDKINNAYNTGCICCIIEACSGGSNYSVTPASPPIVDLLEKIDVMHEGEVLSFPRVNKTYSDLFLKHIAYNRLVCNAAKHAMIPHGGVLYMTFLGASKFASNDSTFVSGKEGLYAKRCIAVSGNCLSLREACINRILWHHGTDTLAS